MKALVHMFVFLCFFLISPTFGSEYSDEYSGIVETQEDCKKDKCDCPANGESICGTDEVTYKSYCSLNCAKKCNKDLDVKSQGACAQLAPINKRNWRKERKFLPSQLDTGFSTSNEKTQDDLLAIEYSQEEDEKERKLVGKRYYQSNFYGWNSNQIQKFQSPFHYRGGLRNPCDISNCKYCNTQWNPFCGSDGYTYENKCHLNCVRHKCSSGLKIQYEGVCYFNQHKITYPNPHQTTNKNSKVTTTTRQTTQRPWTETKTTTRQMTQRPWTETKTTKRPMTTPTMKPIMMRDPTTNPTQQMSTFDHMDTFENLIHFQDLENPNRGFPSG